MTRVLVTTHRDIICPSTYHTTRSDVRCIRGVGHEGRCKNGKKYWQMTQSNRELTAKRVSILAQELGWLPNRPRRGSIMR
jgi:hypothetical protein